MGGLQDPAQAKYDFLDTLEERGTKKKDLLRIETIIEHWAEPGKWPDVKYSATELVGMKESRWFYRLLSKEEREEMEIISLELRRTRYAKEMAEIDTTLLDHAKAGSATHIKLAYQRFEGQLIAGGKEDAKKGKAKVTLQIGTGIDRPPSEGEDAGNGLQAPSLSSPDTQKP